MEKRKGRFSVKPNGLFIIFDNGDEIIWDPTSFRPNIKGKDIRTEVYIEKCKDIKVPRYISTKEGGYVNIR